MKRRATLVAATIAWAVATAAARAAPVDIHPAGAAVPENLLRIELRFEMPQPLPFDLGRVRLLDATGVPIEDAFLDLALASADARRITVLMHPGRVKTGVRLNVAMGRALHAGTTVRLEVDDPSVRPRRAIKEWRVDAAERRGPQPSLWRLAAPRSRSRDALVVSLGAPIGSAAETWIAVVDGAGHRIAGRAALADGDTVWRFTPGRPWSAGRHAVVTHPDLEDVAGNRMCASFEQRHASDVRCDAGATLPFEPAPPLIGARGFTPIHSPLASR